MDQPAVRRPLAVSPHLPNVLALVAVLLALLAVFTPSVIVRIVAAASAVLLLAGAGATFVLVLARLPDSRVAEPGPTTAPKPKGNGEQS